jgi:hypothetical protein
LNERQFFFLQTSEFDGIVTMFGVHFSILTSS